MVFPINGLVSTGYGFPKAPTAASRTTMTTKTMTMMQQYRLRMSLWYLMAYL